MIICNTRTTSKIFWSRDEERLAGKVSDNGNG